MRLDGAGHELVARHLGGDQASCLRGVDEAAVAFDDGARLPGSKVVRHAGLEAVGRQTVCGDAPGVDAGHVGGHQRQAVFERQRNVGPVQRP